MKLISLEQTSLKYNGTEYQIKEQPFFVTDIFAKHIFENNDNIKSYAIKNNLVQKWNIRYNKDKHKKILIMTDLDAFSSLCLMPVINALKENSEVTVYPFSNKSIFEYFNITLQDCIPSIKDIDNYDAVYTLFKDNLVSYDFDATNRIKFFEKFFDIDAQTIKPFIKRKENKNIVSINSNGLFYFEIKNAYNIDTKISIQKDNFDNKTIQKLIDAISNAKVVITAHPFVAYICHINSIPCIFIAGGFDTNVFGEKTKVKLLKSPYIGISCSAPCMKQNGNLCTEAQLKNSSVNPCMQLEIIPEQSIEDSIKKATMPLYKEYTCKLCNTNAIFTLVDLEHDKIYYECNNCKSVYSNKEDYIVDKNIAFFDYMHQLSLKNYPTMLSIFGKLHYIDIAYMLKASNIKSRVLVYRALNGELSYILNYLGFDTINIEHDENLKRIGFILFGTKYDNRKIEDIINEIDVVCIPDILLLQDLNVLNLFKDKYIIIGAPNKDSTLKALNRYNDIYKSYVSTNTFVNLMKNINANNTYIYNSADLSIPNEYFGDILANTLNLTQTIQISLFENQNFQQIRNKFGTYVYATNFKIDIDKKELLTDVIKYKEAEKSIFMFHKNYLHSFDEPYIDIYSEGNKGKVLITDHFELVSNYIELFTQKNYTVGVLKKDIPMNLGKLKREVKQFAPDFMLSGFFGDILWMRNENKWDKVERDFWFKEFDFPIIAIKVDHPLIGEFKLTRAGLDILRKYSHKFAIIQHDKHLVQCYRKLGINAFWLSSFGFTRSNFDISYKDHTMPNEEKIIDILFPGSIHELNNETYNKYRREIDCYLKDITDIRNCMQDECIVNNYFNEEYLDKATKIFSYVRAHYLHTLKEKYKDKLWTVDLINIPYARLKYVLAASKITFYIHSQGFSTVHDMIFEAPLYNSLPIVDRKEEAEIYFPEYYKEITYTNLDDATKKIEYYLKHENERKVLVKELQCIIEKYYKQDFRADFVEYVLMQLQKV